MATASQKITLWQVLPHQNKEHQHTIIKFSHSPNKIFWANTRRLDGSTNQTGTCKKNTPGIHWSHSAWRRLRQRDSPSSTCNWDTNGKTNSNRSPCARVNATEIGVEKCRWWEETWDSEHVWWHTGRRDPNSRRGRKHSWDQHIGDRQDQTSPDVALEFESQRQSRLLCMSKLTSVTNSNSHSLILIAHHSIQACDRRNQNLKRL